MWLHRYDLTFMITNGKIRISFLKDYHLSSTPFSGEFIPWSEQDDVPCLVFQKSEESRNNSNDHMIKILVPEFGIEEDRFVVKMNSKSETMSFYVYNVHDHFHDIRGTDRESQLNLALILIKVNKNQMIDRLNLTPLQYAIKILKSCLNNRPFSPK